MDGDGGREDLASKEVGGGTDAQERAGRLTWDSRVGGRKTLQPSQRPFLLVGGTCYDWASSFSVYHLRTQSRGFKFVEAHTLKPSPPKRSELWRERVKQ